MSMADHPEKAITSYSVSRGEVSFTIQTFPVADLGGHYK